ncbi:unnamed protein product [Rhizoctonia solani]|uniref:BTB domain-containing protein n=1 Tax=Rhizoctonia solani TaxID=456999 RepID=A0A8H3E5T2_9AGAM|nr:unnamed protein product [Rhizoctonia solani]
MNPESSRPTSLHSARVVSFAGTVRPDTEPTVSLNNKRSDADTAAIEGENPAHVHPEFAFADGNVEVQTTDQMFWVHEYHLNKFAVFATLIQEAKNSDTTPNSGRRLILVCDKATKGEDIYNTLKVIYASHIDGIPDFDSRTLTSTLRIASLFDYPALRKFAISKLEGMNIPAIQRIQLSDEFSLAEWETPAFIELCSRVESISQAEAEVLGMTRFVEIARIRETARDECKVKHVGEELLQLVDNLLQAEGSVNEPIQESPEYCSGRSQLPECNCRRGMAPGMIIRCDVHRVAPQVLEEGQLLLKQRNKLLEQLASIRSAVNRGSEPISREPPSDTKVLDNISRELSKVAWIRRNCGTESHSNL